MKLSALLIIIVTSGLPAWSQSTGGSNKPPPVRASKQRPKISLDTAEWRFGVVWQGDVPARPIMLKNEGDAPLEILGVTTSCACTAAAPDSTSLAPGESTLFSISVDTHERSGPLAAIVTVKSNDPLNPRQQIAVSGRVRPVFKIDPPDAVLLGRIATGTQLTRAVEIHNLYPEPAHLSLETSGPKPWEVKLVEVKPGRDYRLEVKSRPPMPPGLLTQVVTLKTGLKRVPELSVTIKGFVQPAVTVTPTRILVPRAFKRRTEKTVRVTYDSTFDLEIAGVRVVGAEKVSAEVLPASAAPAGGPIATRRIRVQLPAGIEMPRQGARLEILTNHPEFKKLVVYFNEPPPRARRVLRRPGAANVVETPTGPGKEPVKP